MQTLDRTRLRPRLRHDLVRLGPRRDGGYVVPADAVGRATVLVAAGIKQDWSFEKHFVRAGTAVRVIGIDPTIGPWLFARQIASGLAGLLGSVLRRDRRAARRHTAHVRVSADYFAFFGIRHRHIRKYLSATSGGQHVTLRDVLDGAGVSGDHRVFLKMDIEGGEYGIVPDVLREERRIGAVVIEFHRLGRKPGAFNEAVEQLQRHFQIVHVHGNNYGDYDKRIDFPDAVEVTFVNQALVDGAPGESALEYPVPGLDFPNKPSQPDYRLRFD